MVLGFLRQHKNHTSLPDMDQDITPPLYRSYPLRHTLAGDGLPETFEKTFEVRHPFSKLPDLIA